MSRSLRGEVEGPIGQGGSQEEKLVNEITAPGGVKSLPPRDMLNSFLSR